MADAGGAIRFRGVWATVLLAIKEDGTHDLSVIDDQIAVYAVSGCDGIYVGGTVSEFHSLSDADFKAVAESTAKAARCHGLPFQIAASHPLAPGSLSRVRYADALEPDGVQVTLPDWTPIDLATVERFLSGCAEAAGGTPLVLYNPPFAKTVLNPKQILALCDQIPALAGVKCGGGDADWYRQMMPVFERLSVFIPGHHYHSGTMQGAHGSYSNMACLSPTAAVNWCSLKTEDAHDLESRIHCFMNDAIAPLLKRGLPGFACDKAMAAAGGWTEISPRLLWPYEGASEAEVEHIARAARRHIPEFLEEVPSHV
ncbi:MAG: dihydrodipicolinate synthase family protein [Pseudomonadota bacterium]